MTRRPFAITVILLVLFQWTYADTFMVTSNFNAGPGTLRDAIEKANSNGTAVVDYIYFNIPSTLYKPRIIELSFELPALTSNIIIDASTQPGAYYGTTEAKVCIRKSTYVTSFSMLKIENATNVQLYGLHLYYGYWQGVFGTPARSELLYGVNISNSSNIIIGSPGKGNVITGVKHGIYSNSTNCSNITIRSNYMGHAAFFTPATNDVDDVIVASDCCITLANFTNVYIGGPLAADGNIFGSRVRAINIDTKNPGSSGVVRIQNNIFARLYDKTTVVSTYDSWDTYIKIGRSRNNPIAYTATEPLGYRVELLDNDIPNDVSIFNITDSLIALRNKFVYDGRTQGAKLIVNKCASGLIGSDDPADANLFQKKKADPATFSISIQESGAITMLKNLFTCNSTFSSTTEVTSSNAPFAQVDVTTSSSASGRATANARVDLYYDDECTACEGKTYIGMVTADAAGNWTYAGTINGTVIAMATRNGYSGAFSTPKFDHSAQKVVQPACGLKNGSITGVITAGAETFFWIETKSGDTVSKQKDLVNVGPGDYCLFAVHGGTCLQRSPNVIKLEDISSKITAFPAQQNPACGLANGSLLGLKISNPANSKIEWKNEAGIVVGTQLDMNKLSPGKYTFYATDIIGGCAVNSPTYDLVNQSGPSLSISALQITPTTCGYPNGSITGLVASNVLGTPFIQWLDSANNIVSSDYALSNAATGKYRFKFKDASTCDTIIQSYTIPAASVYDSIKVTNYAAKDGICDQPAASVAVYDFNKNPSGYSFRWVNQASGATVGVGASISALPAGTYQLFATDKNGCEGKIFTTSLKIRPKPRIDNSAIIVKDDECNQQKGSISVMRVNFLLGPTTYAWFDENNNPVGTNSAMLPNLKSGTYHLEVTDAGTCTVPSDPIVVVNNDAALPAPAYNDLVISRYASATLSANNRSTGVYSLFTDEQSAHLQSQNSTGIFNIKSILSDTAFFVQQIRGTCSSPVVKIVIRAIDKSYFAIPNAFTPNYDGKNDLLNVRVVGSMQLNYFRVFNRYGQLVFETNNSSNGWDGACRGLAQPEGTYIWMTEGKDHQGNILREKGSFLLIR